MLNILDCALAFPRRTERLQDLADELSLSRNQMRMFERFFGFAAFRCDPGETLQALVGEASATVLARHPGLAARLSHVVHCHTLPSVSVHDGRTSPVLAAFAEAGLEVFAATMNHCATGLSMLGAMDRLLGENDVGLILIGEKAFHPDIRVIENTTIMGEAAAAILVGRGPGPYAVLETCVRHAPRFWLNSGHRDEPYLEGFDEAYLDFVCESLAHALARAGISADAVGHVLPHNVNTASWLRIAQRVGIAPDRLRLSTIGAYGHCFGADPFINLAHAAERGALAPGERALLVSVGLGATASCALIEVRRSSCDAAFPFASTPAKNPEVPQ